MLARSERSERVRPLPYCDPYNCLAVVSRAARTAGRSQPGSIYARIKVRGCRHALRPRVRPGRGWLCSASAGGFVGVSLSYRALRGGEPEGAARTAFLSIGRGAANGRSGAAGGRDAAGASIFRAAGGGIGGVWPACAGGAAGRAAGGAGGAGGASAATERVDRFYGRTGRAVDATG